MPPPTARPDVIVVGAGGVGLSCADELARRGAAVELLDRFPAGTQTSARAAGQSVLVQSDASVAHLTRRSIRRFVELETDTDDGVFHVHHAGSIKLALSGWAAAQVRREVVGAVVVGSTVEEVGLADAARLAPHTDLSSVVAAWHTPEDLYFQPPALLSALRAAALRSGVTIRSGVDVTEFLRSDDRVDGVQTTDGPLRAPTVLVTAGSAGLPLLASAGGRLARLPVTLLRHQLCVRGPLAGMSDALPVVRVIDHAVYCRPDGDANAVFGTYEPHPRVYAPGDVPYDVNHLELDSAPLDAALASVDHVFPGLRQAPQRELRGGVVTMTPDGGYVVDEAAELPGLFFMTGCNVRGLSVAPALGEDLAAWITTGVRPTTLAPYALARFPEDVPAADLEREGVAGYEAIYRDPGSRAHRRP